jgi:hypothetical protein
MNFPIFGVFWHWIPSGVGHLVMKYVTYFVTTLQYFQLIIAPYLLNNGEFK